jgi:hypothetical protein
MKKVNELNEVRKLKQDLAYEKIAHISDILNYKFSVKNTYEIDKNKCAILIEDEGISVRQSYSIEEIIKNNIEIETRILRRAFCMCIGNDEFKQYQELNDR